MLAGFVFGVLEQNDEIAIELCLTDGEDQAVALYGVFEDYRHGDFIKGTQAIQGIIDSLPTLHADCSKATLEADALSLEDWGKFFLQPTAEIEA